MILVNKTTKIMTPIKNTITCKLQDDLRGRAKYLNNRTKPLYKINGLIAEFPLSHTIQTTTVFQKHLSNEVIRTIQNNTGMFFIEQRMIPRQIRNTLRNDTRK